MNIKSFISLCQCPICGCELSISNNNATTDCAKGHRYPLINKRIPAMLLNKEISQNTEQGAVNVGTEESFSAQWQMRKEEDNIWGWNKDEMHDLLLTNSGLTRDQLSEKFVLDLGCGHGIFSMLIAETGADVIGFDISNGFLDTDARLDAALKEKINFIQGDVFNFPLKKEIVDLVWCSGVLHHTPDTKTAFNNVHHVVKKGGRFYLWLYKNVYYTKLLVLIRKLTTKIPEKLLVALCYVAAPLFALVKWFLTVVKLNYRTFEKRTLRENALSIHDTLSPPYRWHHEKEEVIQWFQEAGFENITVSEDSALGIGIYADKV